MTTLFPPGTFPKAPPVDVKKALLLIDLQNDFTEPDGKLCVPNVATFLPNIPTLVNKFRSKGPVIWVRTEYTQSRLTVSPETGSRNVLLQQSLQPEEGVDRSQVSPFRP
jgi:nicotinamidase-related amidase